MDEDDGYLVSFITDENTGSSECILVDAKRFEAGPVVRIALPHKICSGTHAVWADREFIREGRAGVPEAVGAGFRRLGREGRRALVVGLAVGRAQVDLAGDDALGRLVGGQALAHVGDQAALVERLARA